MQKLIYCSPEHIHLPHVFFNDINKFLADEWKVISVTPQNVSRSGDSSYTTAYAGFAVLIEKIDEEIKL
jgi:hypothetical protein